MTIYKYTKNWYIARGKVNNRTRVGYGTTHYKALLDALNN